MEEVNFEQQRLLNEPTNYERITNVRLRKELQFLNQSKLQYSLSQVINERSDRKSLTTNRNQANTNQKDNNSDLSQLNLSNQKSEINYCITFQNLSHLQEPLTLLIPKNYPFQQPLYYYETSIPQISKQITDQQLDQKIKDFQNQCIRNAHPISQVLVWLPKYKIMQLVQLIAIKLNQKHQQQTTIDNHIIGKIFNYINTPSLLFLIAVLIRILVGLGSYSGKNDWPNLGDFQAHRNWMSITVNRPLNEWYLESNQNIWWRIDYPPIAAYLSHLLGSVYKFIEPQAMALQRGYQSLELFTFMRLSVLLVECIFLFPSIYLITQYLHSNQNHMISKKFINLFLFAFLLKPDIILIDHGHFQYNSLILGLILGAFYCLLNRSYYTCCLLFTIAIHSKQMSVYYAFAFFGGLIGSLWRDYKGNNTKIIIEIVKFGFIVIFASILIWLPFILTNSAHIVVQAIFPIHRGLYQLKVQNFWCISDVVFKWERMFTNNHLMLICFLISTLLSVPSILSMIFTATKKNITIGFYTVAMTFFMFSYHVHQKSILLPLLMTPLMIQYLGVHFVTYLILAGTMGMYHLLKEDGQYLQYFVLVIYYILFQYDFGKICSQLKIFVYEPDHKRTTYERIHWNFFEGDQSSFLTKLLTYGFYLIFSVLHMSEIFIDPPLRFEYLHHLIFAFFSFCFNSYSLIVCNGILLESLKDKIKGKRIDKKNY